MQALLYNAPRSSRLKGNLVVSWLEGENTRKSLDFSVHDSQFNSSKFFISLLVGEISRLLSGRRPFKRAS